MGRIGDALGTALAWGFTHPPRRRHRATPKTALGLAYARVRLRADDGARLSAWYVPHPRPRALALVLHGYFGHRGTMLPYLRFLHAGGYACLLLDFRGHGWSEGRTVTFGLDELRDARAALTWAQDAPEAAGLPLVVLGESMGAATGLLLAAEHPEVRAVVADSAFARFDSAVRGRLTIALGRALARTVIPHAERAGARVLGQPCEALAPVEAVPALAPRPVFFIHGRQDRLIVPENAHALHAAAQDAALPSALWLVEGAAHVQSVYVAPGYDRRVVAFFDDALA